jgi:large subunit ribosomal protein L16
MSIFDYRKHFKGRNKGIESRACNLSFGEFGMKSIGRCNMNEQQIESVRRVITRSVKGVGKVWIRVYPDIVVTKKPQDTRMGSGKGAPAYKIFRVKPGRVLFEIGGINRVNAMSIIELASAKMPCKVKFIEKEINIQ